MTYHDYLDQRVQFLKKEGRLSPNFEKELEFEKQINDNYYGILYQKEHRWTFLVDPYSYEYIYKLTTLVDSILIEGDKVTATKNGKSSTRNEGHLMASAWITLLDTI